MSTTLRVLAFLKALEQKIPPPPGRHHGFTANQYGSDEAGWEDNLGLHVALPWGFQTLFVGDDDLDKPVEQLVDEVVQLLKSQEGPR